MERRGTIGMIWSITVVMMLVVCDPTFAQGDNNSTSPEPVLSGPSSIIKRPCLKICEEGQVCKLEWGSCNPRKPFCLPKQVCRDIGRPTTTGCTEGDCKEGQACVLDYNCFLNRIRCFPRPVCKDIAGPSNNCTEKCQEGQVCVMADVDCHLQKPCRPQPVCRNAGGTRTEPSDPCYNVKCDPGYRCFALQTQQVNCFVPPCPNTGGQAQCLPMPIKEPAI